MENIIEKVPYANRFLELATAADDDISTLMVLQEYVAEQIEMAYIAGANRLDVNDIPGHGIDDTGQTIVLARGYVRDKGYRK